MPVNRWPEMRGGRAESRNADAALPCDAEPNNRRIGAQIHTAGRLLSTRAFGLLAPP